MFYFQINRHVLLFMLVFLINHHSFSQKKIRFGIRTHPNFSFSTTTIKNSYDKNHFSIKNGLIGFNLSLCSNIQIKRFIIEFSSGINTNKTGLKFKNNQDYSILNIKTVSFINEINLGYRIHTSIKPYYNMFLTFNYSFSITAIQKLSGQSRFENISNYEETYPNINSVWKSHNLGLGLKIRTQINFKRKFDYGISYQYSFQDYPKIGMLIQYNTNSFETLIKPRIHTININFIYYFNFFRK